MQICAFAYFCVFVVVFLYSLFVFDAMLIQRTLSKPNHTRHGQELHGEKKMEEISVYDVKGKIHRELFNHGKTHAVTKGPEPCIGRVTTTCDQKPFCSPRKACANTGCQSSLPIGLFCIWRQHGVQQPHDFRKLVPPCRNSLNISGRDVTLLPSCITGWNRLENQFSYITKDPLMHLVLHTTIID